MDKNAFFCFKCNKISYSKNKSYGICSNCNDKIKNKRIICDKCGDEFWGTYRSKYCKKCRITEQKTTKKDLLKKEKKFNILKDKNIDKELKKFIISYWHVNREFAKLVLEKCNNIECAKNLRKDYFGYTNL